MAASYPPIAMKNAGLALEELLPQVVAMAPRRQAYLRICRCYRQVGIGALLSSGDPAPFFAALFKSGRAYLHFLRIAPEDEKLTSQSEPFFDAVACRDHAGALEVAQRSRSSFAAGREYEEDFWHARFLMERFFLGAPDARLLRLLDDWSALAPDDPRLALCQALHARDQSGLDSALAEAIDERVQRFAQAKERGALPADDAATVAHVSTEVLAWLELAQGRGLSVPDDAPLAPGLARRFARMQHPAPEAWKVPEVYRSFARSP